MQHFILAIVFLVGGVFSIPPRNTKETNPPPAEKQRARGNICPDGSLGSFPVYDMCNWGTTYENGVCCNNNSLLTAFCGPTPNQQSIGSCTTAGSCGVAGYACNVELGLCCPAIDFVNVKPIGPAVAGMCPKTLMIIYNPNLDVDPIGSCYDLALIPGGCDATSVGPCKDFGQCDAPETTCYVAKNQCCPSVPVVPTTVKETLKEKLRKVWTVFLQLNATLTTLNEFIS